MSSSTKQNKIKLTRKIKEKEPQDRLVNVVYYKIEQEICNATTLIYIL